MLTTILVRWNRLGLLPDQAGHNRRAVRVASELGGLLVDRDLELATLGTATRTSLPHPGSLDLVEVSSQAQVVVLCPSLIRMIVALGTLQSHTQEQLGGRLGEVLLQELLVGDRLGRQRDAEVIHRCVAVRLADGGQQLTSRLVERLVTLDPAPQPGLELLRSLEIDRIAGDPQHIKPLLRPVVGVLGPLQQLLDPPRATIRTRRGQERLGLGRSRQHTAEVDVDTTHELFVGAQPRGCNVELLQLGKDVRVDVVRFRRIRPGVVRRRLGNVHQPHRLHPAHEPAQDRHLALASEFHLPDSIDVGDRNVAAGIRRQAGDVGHLAIREFRLHGQPLPLGRSLEHSTAGCHDQRLQRHRPGIVMKTFSLPASHQLGQLAARCKPATADMRDLCEGLVENQAAVGIQRVGPATEPIVCQLLKVEVGIEAPQAETKAVLAAGRTVAANVAAAGNRQHRHELAAETDRLVFPDIRHRHRGRCR